MQFYFCSYDFKLITLESYFCYFFFQVAIGSDNGQIKVYNDDTFNLNIRSFQAHTNAILRIKQSPFNSKYVATSSYDGTVKIWNANTNWT